MTALTKISVIAILSMFAILPLSAQTQLESLFINVTSYYDDMGSIYKIVSGIDGVTDSNSNTKKHIITLMYDADKTSKEEILSKISSMGYGIKYKSIDVNSQLYNVKYEKVAQNKIEELKAKLENDPYVMDYYYNPKNNIMSIIYAESNREKGMVYESIHPVSNSYSIYLDGFPKKFLNKN